MKILWITNSILPDLAKALKIRHLPFEGWLVDLAQEISKKPDVELIIATSQKNKGRFYTKIANISYYMLETKKPNTVYDSYLEKQWEDIINKVNPDIIHLQGSESANALPLIKINPSGNYVLSIQGLISVYARYYLAGLSLKDVLNSLTIRSFIKKDSILNEQKSFTIRGNKIEKEYFKKVQHFIGRTSWDFAHTKYLSNDGTYHFCNEMLRSQFYKEEPWQLEKCTPYSIFISQGNYPIKGMHQVLNALILLKTEFPNVKLFFAGRDILTTQKGLKNKIKEKNYGKYLRKFIRSNKLENSVFYLGTLGEKEMIKAYKNANVFICPSSIENSPNSLAEAQMLGVPCIASYVGGNMDMVEDGISGLLYRFEEFEMLAQKVSALFKDEKLSQTLSTNGRKAALKRHHKETIIEKTISIYNTINKIETLKS